MKLLAARSREDAEDIRFLCGLLGIRTVSEALAVALELYPEERFTVRTRLILEEVLGPEGGGEDAHGPDFIKTP